MQSSHSSLAAAMAMALVLSATIVSAVAAADPATDTSHELESVVVNASTPPQDAKPYKNLLKAMKVFESNRDRAPRAVMRFKVFPSRDEAVMQGLTLTLLGETIERALPLADDGSFTIDTDVLVTDERARVVSNRPPRSLAWRADIRTPGLPANTRRLGDLRLECKVDYAGGAELYTTTSEIPLFVAIAAVMDPCMNRTIGYFWLADRPILSVTLVSGARRETVPIHTDGLPYTGMYGWNLSPLSFDYRMDWYHHLRDRVYTLAIQDTSWPDDTQVLFESMSGSDAVSDGGCAR